MHVCTPCRGAQCAPLIGVQMCTSRVACIGTRVCTPRGAHLNSYFLVSRVRVYVSIVSKEVTKNWGKNAHYILKHEYSRLKIIDLMYFQDIQLMEKRVSVGQKRLMCTNPYGFLL